MKSLIGMTYLRLRKGCSFLKRHSLILKRDEKADLVSALGWMAITAVILVAISTVLSGGMTSLVESIFVKLEGLLI